MKVPGALRTAGIAAATLLVVAATIVDTRIAFLNEFEGDWLVLALHRLQFVLGPLAVLLFAFGVHWAATRRFGRALLALPALPVWSLLLVELNTFTGTPLWMALYLAPFRGIQPFGASPT